MKLCIESTTKIVTLVVNGVDVAARIWEGEAEDGTPVHCYITRVAAPNDGRDLSLFERDLQEHRTPSVEIQAIPLRLIL